MRGKAGWKLPDGDLEYFDINITELPYDFDAGDHVSVPAPSVAAR